MTTLTRLLHRAGARESKLRLPGDSTFSVAVQACRQAREIHQVMGNERRRVTASGIAPELVALDLGSTALTYWMLLAENRHEAGQRLLWPGETGSTRVMFILRGLLTGIINDLLAVRALLPLGLAQPLRSVFRNLLELGLVSVALTVDERYFRDYIAWADAPQGDLKAWSKVKPSVAQRAVGQSLLRAGLSDAERTEFDGWRRGTYAWLSAFDHGHPIALAVTAFNWDGKVSAGRSLGGAVDSSITTLAGQIIWATYEFFSLLTGSLFRTHNWRGDGSAFSAEVLLSTRFFQAFALELMAMRDASDNLATDNEFAP